MTYQEIREALYGLRVSLEGRGELTEDERSALILATHWAGSMAGREKKRRDLKVFTEALADEMLQESEGECDV